MREAKAIGAAAVATIGSGIIGAASRWVQNNAVYHADRADDFVRHGMRSGRINQNLFRYHNQAARAFRLGARSQAQFAVGVGGLLVGYALGAGVMCAVNSSYYR